MAARGRRGSSSAETSVSSSQWSSPAGSSSRRWPLLAGVALLVALAVPLLVVAGVRLVLAGEALPGTTVAGVDVGGLGEADLRQRLSEDLAARTRDPVVLLAPDGREFPLEPADVSYAPDVDATTAAALSAGRDGLVGGAVEPLRSLAGTTRRVPLSDDLDAAAVSGFVATVAAEVDRPADPGTVGVEVPEGAAAPVVTSTAPAAGTSVRRGRTEEVLGDGLRRAGVVRVDLPVRPVEPTTRPEQVAGLAESLRGLLAAPVLLTASPEVTLSFSPLEVAPLLSVAPDAAGTALETRVDDAAAGALVAARAPEVEQVAASPRLDADSPVRLDAQGSVAFSPAPATVTVVSPAATGRDVDEAGATASLVDALRAVRQQGPLPVSEVPPPVTDAQAAQVSTLLGTFTTYHACCEGRVTNIQRMAQLLDGTLVAPGASFSLNDAVGPRTRAKGFVAAGTIIDREIVDTVGGGVSQFATTLYNAVYFAGLQVDDHKSHSRYISRYPVGREATVNYDNVDLAWTNDTDAPVLVTTSSTGRSILVSVLGAAPPAPQTVRAVHGGRSAGGPNFTITVTRVVERGGAEASRDSFTTRYEEGRDEQEEQG